MHVIIYGKDDCINCDKSKLLCQIKSVGFEYRAVGADISVDELRAKLGVPVRSLPQIFIRRGESTTHVGGYDELRRSL